MESRENEQPAIDARPSAEGTADQEQGKRAALALVCKMTSDIIASLGR